MKFFIIDWLENPGRPFRVFFLHKFRFIYSNFNQYISVFTAYSITFECMDFSYDWLVNAKAQTFMFGLLSFKKNDYK
ncbi:hypothetical protein GCM10010831_22480 [Psychroflexus salis]|uniref:Uncharacterized protein n=1 Tax=Psychroflexus salis TaxID=1526574 RepID=A0A917EBW4_9FLAO|nr:hypothetical protein GCM10010831_22480 [Psychroflexus salis]